jgi:hypothetical protein
MTNETAKSNKKPDWEAMIPDWRAGVLSGRAVADKFDVNESTLRKAMKKMGIERDLSAEVRKAARTQLFRTELLESKSDEEIIQEAAAEQVTIVRTHQKFIRRGMEVYELLMEELVASTLCMEEIKALIHKATADDENSKRRDTMMKLLSLANRAEIAQKLANTLKSMITLQRQAHGIDANPEPLKDELSELLTLIDGKTTGLPCAKELS